jgi:membrane-associated protease RseP (regulator of RpoE activity)
MRSRKALFDIGIAGPLAGLVVAIPLLIIGLMFSQVGRPSDFIELQEGMAVTQEGNSLVYLAAKYAVFGRVLPDESGQDVWLSQPASPGGPVAFAAWAGLLVTMFNLLPVGQLDGGHIAYALLGRRAWRLAYVMIGLIGALVIFLLVNDSPAAFTWLLWVVLMLVVQPRHPPPLNDVTPLDWRRKWLGVLMGVIFVLIYVPLPLVPVQ